jgi:DNA (cytosine-5)-methyltransferase 1
MLFLWSTIIMNKELVALFSGAGGLDKGFEKAGFHVAWANEYDKSITATFKANFPNTKLDTRSIREVQADEIPDCIGIIGGPPCQSWSEAGALRGIEDPRGQLFYEFIRVLRAKKPLFFLAENVAGMLAPRHTEALKQIQVLLKQSGYRLSFELLNAVDYGVPQDRKRVFFVGYREDLNLTFEFPKPLQQPLTLQNCIADLKGTALPANTGNTANLNCTVPNHEYMTGGFSTIFMSRNRVRSWHEPSFTIQAGGRHAPIHPQAPKMQFIEQNVRQFVKGQEHLYRRLSVRECARIQTFPDEFVFHYKQIADGYKMVGNAVPVELAYHLAKKIMTDLNNIDTSLLQPPKTQQQELLLCI